MQYDCDMLDAEYEQIDDLDTPIVAQTAAKRKTEGRNVNSTRGCGVEEIEESFRNREV